MAEREDMIKGFYSYSLSNFSRKMFPVWLNLQIPAVTGDLAEIVPFFFFFPLPPHKHLSLSAGKADTNPSQNHPRLPCHQGNAGHPGHHARTHTDGDPAADQHLLWRWRRGHDRPSAHVLGTNHQVSDSSVNWEREIKLGHVFTVSISCGLKKTKIISRDKWSHYLVFVLLVF